MERTLVLVKPDGIINIEKIIDIFYKNGLKIDNYKIMQLDEDLVAEHYSHLLDRPFYNNLKAFMMSAPIAAMILSGDNAVLKVRELIGKTNSKEALPGTIRNLYGTDATQNAVHASDSIENAEIEINRFFNRKKEMILK